jgi:hypothetical protein
VHFCWKQNINKQKNVDNALGHRAVSDGLPHMFFECFQPRNCFLGNIKKTAMGDGGGLSKPFIGHSSEGNDESL